MDQALWEAIGKIGGALPRPEHVEIDGEEEVAAWRNAFRIIQGFEIQSTLLPFIQSHNVQLGPGIKERFDMAAAITLAEADAARALRAEIADHLLALISIGTLIVLPTMPTLPPERDIPDGASFSEFRGQTSDSPALPAIPACRRSRCRPDWLPVARWVFPSLAGPAATRRCSILPSILSRF